MSHRTAPPAAQRHAAGFADSPHPTYWNRYARQNQTESPLRGGDHQWSARPASNQRHELSAALSDDDGQTWTPPVVILTRDKADAVYPYVFEHQPGHLWITTMRGNIALNLRETDLLPR